MVLLSSSAFDDTRLLPFSLNTTRMSRESIQACIIVSASPMKENGPNAIKTMDYLINNGVLQTRFVDLCDGETAKETIRHSDLIVVNGGNPFLLLATLQEQNFLSELGELCSSEKIVIGVSAGGMIFSPGLHLVEEFNQIMGFDDKGNSKQIKDLNCLNLFDEYFFPHFDRFSEKVMSLSDQLNKLEHRTRTKIFRQNNGQTARVINRNIESLILS